ncbi:flagellar basal-body protein [Azospirillum doebereinerae]
MDKVDVRFPQPAKAAPSNLPKNAFERATALVDLMGRLTLLLQREAAAVRARRPTAELLQMAKEKQPMSLVYEEISRMLRVDRDGVIALPAELKTALKEATGQLYAASADNAEALRVGGQAQKIVVDTVVAAVTRAQKAPATAYAAHMGGGRGYAPPPSGPRTSSALNKQL